MRPLPRTSPISGCVCLQLAEPRHERVALARRAVHDAVHEEVDVGERGGAAHGVAAEGGEVVADLEGVGDLGAGDEGAQRPAVGDALGHGHDVRHDAEVLDGEQLAGAPEAALHLVGDEQDALLVEDLLDGA